MSLLHPRYYSKRFSAPLNLAASQIAALPAGATQIRLTWTNRRSTYYTNIWFSNGTYISYVNPGVTTYDVTGLASNTSYSFIVTHSDGNGKNLSLPSNVASATTQIKFDSPTSFVASQRGDLPAGVSTLTLSWVVGQPGDVVRVWRTGAGVGWQTVVELPAGTTQFTDTGLAANTTYTYIVRHIRGGYETADNASNSSAASTQVQFNAPTGFTISNVLSYPAGTTQLALNWVNAQAGDQIQIYRYQTSWNYLTTVGAGTTSYVDSGLAPGTYFYYYLVHIRNGYQSGLIQAGPVATHPPMPSPVNLALSNVGISSINLNWTNGSGSDTVRVYVNTGGGYYPTDYGPGTTSLQVGGLPAGTTCTFVVRHVRYGTESSDPGDQSNWRSATTQFPAPAAPYNLQVGVLSDTQLVVYWANGDGGAQTDVFLNGGYLTSVGPGGTQCQIGGLARCTNYTIGLRAQKNGVYSGVPSIVGRPRMYVSGGYTQADGSAEYHWYYRGDFNITLQVSGQINYCGFGLGGNGGPGGQPADEGVDTGGGGGGGGGAFLQYDNVEPAGTYYVQIARTNVTGNTTYRGDVANYGNWGEQGQVTRGGYGGSSGGGAGSANPAYGGGAPWFGGAGNSSGGGGGGGAAGGGGQGYGPGGPGGPGIGLPIFGTVCPGGYGGRGANAGQNASQWGGGGGGGNPGGAGVGADGGFLVWFPI